MWGELSSEWGELSSECGASCLGASFLWGELSLGELSLGRVVHNPVKNRKAQIRALGKVPGHFGQKLTRPGTHRPGRLGPFFNLGHLGPV